MATQITQDIIQINNTTNKHSKSKSKDEKEEHSLFDSLIKKSKATTKNEVESKDTKTDKNNLFTQETLITNKKSGEKKKLTNATLENSIHDNNTKPSTNSTKSSTHLDNVNEKNHLKNQATLEQKQDNKATLEQKQDNNSIKKIETTPIEKNIFSTSDIIKDKSKKIYHENTDEKTLKTQNSEDETKLNNSTKIEEKIDTTAHIQNKNSTPTLFDNLKLNIQIENKLSSSAIDNNIKEDDKKSPKGKTENLSSTSTSKTNITILDTIINKIENELQSTKQVDVNLSLNKTDLHVDVYVQNTQKYNETIKNLEPKNLIEMNQYLNSQKQKQNLQSLQVLHEAKKILSGEKNEKSIKDAATILNLKPNNLTIEEKNSTTTLSKIVSNNNTNETFQTKYIDNHLHRAYLKEENEIQVHESLKKEVQQDKVIEEIKINTKTTTHDETIKQKEYSIQEIKNIELKVEKNTIEQFTTRIIASKQKVESFMSDLAKQMYQNYRPPITAFRLTLNPSNLGTIAILIKTNKNDNNLSVGMNISNSDTYEVLNENKDTLHEQILKNFNSEQEISLDMGFNKNEEFEDSFHDDFNTLINNTSNELTEDITSKQDDTIYI